MSAIRPMHPTKKMLLVLAALGGILTLSVTGMLARIGQSTSQAIGIADGQKAQSDNRAADTSTAQTCEKAYQAYQVALENEITSFAQASQAYEKTRLYFIALGNKHVPQHAYTVLNEKTGEERILVAHDPHPESIRPDMLRFMNLAIKLADFPAEKRHKQRMEARRFFAQQFGTVKANQDSRFADLPPMPMPGIGPGLVKPRTLTTLHRAEVLPPDPAKLK